MRSRHYYISGMMMAAAALGIAFYAWHSGSSNATANNNNGFSSSGDTSGNVAGVDYNISYMINRRAQQMVINSEAYAREIVNKPESVLDMSCFSGSTGNIGNLASLFSDLKNQFNFSISGNPLCSALNIAAGASAQDSLNADLSKLFKLPGISLPSFKLCGPSFDVAGDLQSVLNTVIGAGMPTLPLSGGTNFFGCNISMDIKITGSVKLTTPCVSLKLPSLSCNTASKLFQDAGLKALKAMGIDLGGKVNYGPLYLSTDEQGKIGAGIDTNLVSDNEYVKSFKKDLDTINKFIKTFGAFSGGLQLKGNVGFSFDSNDLSKMDGSGDGLTSDGGFSIEPGSAINSGSGQEFLSVRAVGTNKEISLKVHSDQENLAKGPGGSDAVNWKTTPNFQDKYTLSDVITKIKEAGGSSNGTNGGTTSPAGSGS